MPHRYYTLRNQIVLSDLQPPRKPLVVEVRRVRHLKGDLLIIERCSFCATNVAYKKIPPLLFLYTTVM
jgi:hypothetical protein